MIADHFDLHPPLPLQSNRLAAGIVDGSLPTLGYAFCESFAGRMSKRLTKGATR